MQIKLFEIRDKATFIPAMAIKLGIEPYQDKGEESSQRQEQELWLLRRAGYSLEVLTGNPQYLTPYIILCKLDGVEAQYDSFSWSNPRTMGTAHRTIIEAWDELKSGDVIDVQFIIGETHTPKISERLTVGNYD